jgi:hypothetical protein
MHSLELHDLILHMQIAILLCLYQAGGNEGNVLHKGEIGNKETHLTV